jgi:hypothetical protein
LAVELLRRSAHGGPLLGGLGAGAPGGELRLHDFVEEVLFDLGAEHLVGQVDLADRLALEVVDRELHVGRAS